MVAWVHTTVEEQKSKKIGSRGAMPAMERKLCFMGKSLFSFVNVLSSCGVSKKDLVR